MFLFSSKKDKFGRKGKSGSSMPRKKSISFADSDDDDDEQDFGGGLCAGMESEKLGVESGTNGAGGGGAEGGTSGGTLERSNSVRTEDSGEEVDFNRQLTTHLDADMQRCFESFDVIGNGAIEFNQLKSALASFYIEADDDDIKAIIDSFDTTGTGKITFPDFYREMRDVMAGGTTEMHIRMVYSMMDEDDDGAIGINEIRKQFEKLGISISDEEAMTHITKIDPSSSGDIDFEMFRTFCNSNDIVKVIGQKTLERLKDEKSEPEEKKNGH